MKSPNMATMTDSLEQSMRNCSLNHRLSSAAGVAASPGVGRPSLSSSSSSSFSSSDEPNEYLPPHQHHRFDTALELNSHVSLPPYWEQCLDLKTGEIYYINCRSGMKVKEDPRTKEHGQDFYSEEDDSSSDDSEESSSSSSRTNRKQYQQEMNNEDVLVVAGCKRCFMYFMVPKQVEDCPRCSSQLVHFDRPDNGFP